MALIANINKPKIILEKKENGRDKGNSMTD